MHRKMSRRPRLFRAGLALALALFGATFGMAQAESGSRILGPGAMDEPPTMRLIEERSDGISLEFSLPSLVVEEVEFEGQAFQSLAIPGGGDEGPIGGPMLPTFGRFIAVPDYAGVRVELIVEEEEEHAGYRVVPLQDESATTFAYDPAAYARSGFGSDPQVVPGTAALLRGLRVVPIRIAPVRYNPAEGTIRVVRKARLEVSFTGEDLSNATSSPRPLTPSFDRIYRELVVNYPRGEKSGAEAAPGTWLVICRNSTDVTTRLQPLIEWRKRKGYPVYLATTAETGTTKEAIKTWIQNAYNGWANPPEYVVLAGDASGSYSLPCWYETQSGYNGEGDHPYCQLAGNDILADAHLGRLSFESLAELETIVAKMVNYERTPEMSDPGWFTRACLVGDPSSSGYSTIQVQQWIKQRLLQLSYTQIDTIFGGNFVSQMTTALNRGDSFFCYRGYIGMSGWGNSNTYALGNGAKMPFCVISTCGTGSFASSTARSEAFLRAGTATAPRAGIGAIGTATSGTHTRFNNCYTFGTFWGALYKDAWEMGAAHTWGKLNLYLNYQETQSNWVIIFSYWNNLMGDPAGEVWTAVPTNLAVSHPASVATGANSFSVAVTDAGQPCPGALVCLYKSGGTEIQATGITGADGQVELPVAGLTAGTAQLTVSKHDRQCYLADVTVNSPALYVGYAASAVDDDNSGESAGDGDGLINPLEGIELRVQLRNTGSQTASNVTAVLTSESPYVTITDQAETFGSIAAGGTVWSVDDFGFVVDGGCPHGETIRFGLDITSGAEQWHALIDLTVDSATFQPGTQHVYNGGGNGLFDPGETVGLSIALRNTGTVAAEGIQATLHSLSEYVSVPAGVRGYPVIAPGGVQENTANPFSVQARADTPNGYQASMRMVVEFNAGVRDTVDFLVPVGTRAATDPIGPDAYGYWAYDNTDTAYPEAPTYGWIEIDPNYGGAGTQVQLGDYGSYQDKSRAVNLPFTFQHYGQAFTTATICSNGWIQPGVTWMTDYRNWTLPSPGGPDGIIAAFWDDIYEVTSPPGHVYQWFDSANHRWIVQWSRMKNDVSGSAETFQAILHDPTYYPTDTGDGMIIFQYHTVNNPDGTDGHCTVGVESPDNEIGLTYTYFARYPQGAATLAAGRAIKFLPKREVLTGVLHGVVQNASAGGIPLAGVTVQVVESGNTYTTGALGTYSGEELTGSYTVIASRSGFAPDTLEAVAVPAGGSAEADFALQDIAPPVVTMVGRIASTADTLGPYAAEAAAADASPLAEVSLRYRIYDGPWQTLPMAGGATPTYFDAEIPGQLWTTRVDYYVEARDAGGNIATDPPGAPAEHFVFWVGPLLTAYASAFEQTETEWTVGSAEDTAVDGIWEQVDPNGTWHVVTPVQPEDDHTPDPGTICWVTGQAPPDSGEDDNDVEGGATSLVSPRLDLDIDGLVILRYWRWYTNDTQGASDDEWVVEVSEDDGATWKDLERTSVSERQWTRMEFVLSDLMTMTNQVRVRFRASDFGPPSIVEAAVDDFEIVYIGQTPAGVEETLYVPFGFARGPANPARPGSAVRFGLERSGPVQLALYDIQGRRIRTLIEGSLGAGMHTLTWDGRDDRGHLVPSGAYFYRLEAGRQAQNRKILLVH